eukprot:8505935-Lingulodinium_polyedra.AAC.1
MSSMSLDWCEKTDEFQVSRLLWFGSCRRRGSWQPSGRQQPGKLGIAFAKVQRWGARSGATR